MSIYEKEAAQAVVQAIKAAGFRAFLAESGTYGFYTDADGSKIISFQCNGIEGPKFSGNYKTSAPRQTGTGWRISDDFNASDLDKYFNASPPHWAVSCAKWEFTSLADHQATYQASSKYTEV